MTKIKVNNKFASIVIPHDIHTPVNNKLNVKTSNWVKWGDLNKFPNTLINLYNYKFITAKTIINRNAQLLSIIDDSNIEEDEVLENLIRNKFSKDSLNTVLYKTLIDYFITGTSVIEVTWNNSGERISRLEHIPVQNYREDWNNSDKDTINYYYISDNWDNYNTKSEKIQGFTGISPSEDDKNEFKQLLVIKDITNVDDYYTIPGYYGAINYILSEYVLSENILTGVGNNFSAGTLINFTQGNPPDEQKEAIIKDIVSVFSGTANAGKIFVNFAENKDEVVQIESIPTDKVASQYNDLQPIIKNNICIAMNVPNPELFGISDKVGVSFNSSTYLSELLNVYYEIVLNPIKVKFEDSLNQILQINGSDGKINIKKLSIKDEETAE